MGLNTLLKGAGLGAALMYFYDPDRGRRRRARLMDHCDHTSHRVQDFLSKAQRDLKNRATGITHETRARFRPDDADDRTITERVRSKLGRYVSHPRAVDVETYEGRVTLAGPILAHEVDDLLCAVRHVRGVNTVVSRLDVFEEPGDFSALQGGKTPPGEQYDFTQENWSPATRMLAQAAGLTLMGNCLLRRGLTPTLMGTAGFALFLRGATNRSLDRLIGARAYPHSCGFQRTVVIHAPLEKVWDFMTDFEEVGRFLPMVQSVQNLGDGKYRWSLHLPGGQALELEEQITETVPQESLSWESTPGSPVCYEGTVRLERSGDDATRINVHFTYSPPGGVIADKLASLIGRDPESKFHEAVSRVKTFLETGHAPYDVHEVGSETHPAT